MKRGQGKNELKRGLHFMMTLTQMDLQIKTQIVI